MEESEKQKMIAGKPCHSRDPELVADKVKAITFLKSFNVIEDPYNIESKLEGFLGKIGHRIKIGRDFDVTYGFNLFIGDDVSINRGCKFLDTGKITIGNNCFIGPSVNFYATSHPLDPEMRKDPINKDIVFPGNICVEENVWIGGNVTILPGVTIGKNSVVGAGSVVTHDVPENCCVAGNPAKVIKELK